MKYLLPLLFLFACEKSPKPLDHLNWLKGSWQLEDTSLTKNGFFIYENWNSEGDSCFTGKVIAIKNSDTEFLEEMKIVSRSDDFYFIATVRNQNGGESVYYKMKYLNNDSFCFSNPKHDFPKYINYYKNSENSITACISDKMQYLFEFSDYDFRREENFALFKYKKLK